MSVLSSSEFMSDNFSGQPTHQGAEVDAPLSLSSGTTGSAAQATAWRNRSLGGGRPLSLSSKTAGTTFKFDDATPTAAPQSDRGASFGRA